LGFFPLQHFGGQDYWQVQQQSKQGNANISKARPIKKGEIKKIVPAPLICISVIRSPKFPFTRSTTNLVAFAFMYEERADWYPLFVLRSDWLIDMELLVQ
jgi:hypothetical protein